MRVSWYSLNSGKLQKQPVPTEWPIEDLGQLGESWFDIEDAAPEELRRFLTPLRLHPLMLDRCTDLKDLPGVLTYGQAVLLEFPAALDREAETQAYLTFVLQSPVLITIRHGLMSSVESGAELVNRDNAHFDARCPDSLSDPRCSDRHERAGGN